MVKLLVIVWLSTHLSTKQVSDIITHVTLYTTNGVDVPKCMFPSSRDHIYLPNPNPRVDECPPSPSTPICPTSLVSHRLEPHIAINSH